MGRKRVFEPVVTTTIAADRANHAEGIFFKVSYGFELDNPNAVFKVQMVGDGYVKGRQAPSYGDNDFDKIIKVREILKQRFENMDKRLRDIEISEEEIEKLL
ncbi:hypothetical protein [Enterococcus wangshanyuanii]|uniref:Uncharacterized protein n=1 Tax=Enterococcus wangshanyuanii TaxID=2005703 RepID=A0ABQ1PTZ6_9ENTE|nr:hypothetical protein [Enterococcus wangshanyuanii]GGD03587.1 hypothetical protein GCM10011573_36330 [Enterococcus wangshanyuanii]